MSFDLESAQIYHPLNCEIERLDGHDVRIAYPADYAENSKASYGVIIVPGSKIQFDAVVEISRLLASTGECHHSLVIGVNNKSPKAWLEAQLLDWAKGKANATLPVLWSNDGDLNRLAKAMMQQWATGNIYGQQMALMKKAPIRLLTRLFRPLMAKLAARRKPVNVPMGGTIMRSPQLQRDFEIFVSLPDEFDPGIPYPLLLALDGNYAFAPTVHVARNLGDAITQPIIVGLGVPRAEGATAFALRRLQEFAPPIDEYDFTDDLGLILQSLYSLGGIDVRAQFGMAPAMHQFITNQLLPALQSQLPININMMAIFGHSAGGTYVAFEALQNDTPFNQFLCSSPGLGISGEWLMSQKPRINPNSHTVFSIGSAEFSNAFNQDAGIPLTPAYASRWQQAGNRTDLLQLDGQTHSSIIGAALTQGLLAIWGRQ